MASVDSTRDDREQRLDEAVAAFLKLQAAGQTPERTPWLAQFPDLAVELGEFLDEQARVQSLLQPVSQPPLLPMRLGRYEIRRLLGSGGFGNVYLGYDEQLKREVAIKIPHPHMITSQADAVLYMGEAQTVAQLDHPHIVTVYDVGGTEEWPCFIVSKYIAGTDLATRLKQGPLEYVAAAELVATVAETLHYAHQRGLVHRDIKPENILIGNEGQPFIVDFGLAMRDENVGLGPKYVGTPAYMSPEQARGEGHRVDGRSDIFSLGGVLYQTLVGRPPFRGATKVELLEQVTSVEPRPLRHFDAHLPQELGRICQKAMAKRASDRYGTAEELADDLRQFLAEQNTTQGRLPSTDAAAPSSDTLGLTIASSDGSQVTTPAASDDRSSSSDFPVKIVPKGLRSFDAHDANFFLELLPGPRDRQGLPDSLRFWKSRIEELDAHRTFSVGLIYGPSGCGKSSLVKAGLLPLLIDEAIYLEATQEDTEHRLLQVIRGRFPGLFDYLPLTESLAMLRRGRGLRSGQKLLIVLDQFEQWLHADKEYAQRELVQALRQCDGGHVQCILMVRDDFWLAVSRFLKEIEVRLVEGQNCALVDLFDLDHARKVLTDFGRAFGKLPDKRDAFSKRQREFIRLSIAGLAHEGKVIPVRLALFAEMMKSRAWCPATLKSVGGATGIGVTFLEDTFSVPTAPPTHRVHQQAARRVLMALLPRCGTDIKGEMKSYRELFEASAYTDDSRAFEDLIRILDSDIRLITPTDPERHAGHDSSLSHVENGEKYYELTHDYLVPSLRTWLAYKQRETYRGRVELRLEERASAWNAQPERRHLPNWWEYLNIVGLTAGKNWSPSQRKMMRAASTFHGWRALSILLLLLVVSVTSLKVRQALFAEQQRMHREFREQQLRMRSEERVGALVSADTPQVPRILAQLQDDAKWAQPLLVDRHRQAKDGSVEKLHLALALVATDEQHVEYLFSELLTADALRFSIVRDTLLKYRDRLTDRLWAELTKRENDPEQRRLRAAAALASYDSDNPRWASVVPEVATQLVSVNPMFIGTWQEALRPVSDRLIPSLATILTDPQRGEMTKSLATSLLADYAQDDPRTLTNLLLASDVRVFLALFPAVRKHGSVADDLLERILTQKLETSWNEPPLARAWLTPDPRLTRLMEGAHGILAERFAFCQDMPWDVFLRVAEELRTCGYRPTRVRPYLSQFPSNPDALPSVAPGIEVAAIWTRDGRKWKLQDQLTAHQLSTEDPPTEPSRLIPVDCAVWPMADALGTRRFVLLWREPIVSNEQTCLRVDLNALELTASHAELSRRGFSAQSTIGVWTDNGGRRRYLGIWSNQGNPSELAATYSGFDRIDQPQWDVALAPGELLIDPLAGARHEFQEIVGALETPFRHAGVWRAEPGMESKCLQFELPLTASETPTPKEVKISLQRRSRELVTQGYRPVAIAVVGAGVPTSSWHGPTDSRIVFHRPIHSSDATLAFAKQQADAAIALLRQGKREKILSVLRVQDDPETLTQFVHRCRAREVDPRALLECVAIVDKARTQQRGGLKTQEDRALYGLLLALGEYTWEEMPAMEREPILAKCEYWYAHDPSSTIHSVTGWLLRQWNKTEIALRVDETPVPYDPQREWFTLAIPAGEGNTETFFQTYVVMPAGDYEMGSPLTEHNRDVGEQRHVIRITRPFALLDREVTRAEIEVAGIGSFNQSNVDKWFPTPQHAMGALIWYDGVRFCRWLTTRAGLPESEQCYADPQSFGKHDYGWDDSAGAGGAPRNWPMHVDKRGFRLPTEAEWEIAARGGMRTPYGFGRDDQLLDRYAAFGRTTQTACLPKAFRPNPRGFFDLYGNVSEWCHDWLTYYKVEGITTNPSGASVGHFRMLRGGDWSHGSRAMDCRSAARHTNQPADAHFNTGFRVALVPTLSD